MRRAILFLNTGLAAIAVAAAVGPPRASAWQTGAEAKAVDISGAWHFVFQTPGGDRDSTANFTLHGDRVGGKYDNADVKGTYRDGKLDLAFPFHSEEAGTTDTLKLQGALKEGKIEGTWRFGEYDGTFVASRPH